VRCVRARASGRRRAAWAWAGFAEQAEWEARGPVSEKNIFFQFLFSNKFQTKASTQILSKKMAFSGNGPRMKVAYNLILYNFALGTN
jgi:hypothetical protein